MSHNVRNYINEILRQNPTAMISWKNRRKNGDFYRLIISIKRLLELISGGSKMDMLSDVLTRNEKLQLAHKYKDALTGYASVCSKEKPKSRHTFIRPLRQAKMTFREAKAIGFKMSPYLWKSCLKQGPRNKCGPKNISNELKIAINDHMESYSNIASNRFLKRLQTNALYRTISISQAYDLFPFNNEIGYTTFHKYLEKRFKKPHRFTDVCDYCELHTKLQLKIITSINEICNELAMFPDTDWYSSNINVVKLKEFFQRDIFKNHLLLNSIISDLEYFEELEYHRNIAKRQRIMYNEMRNNKNLLKDRLLIEIDFKQKVVIGMGPRDTNSAYYSRIQRSYLSFGTYHTENDEIISDNFDFVIGDVSQTAYTVVRTFRYLRTIELFKQIDKKNYIIWVDCGMHFRCAEFLHFLFEELHNDGIEICLNFFAEKHGKNQRDQHFSTISYYVEIGSLEKRLTTSEDIVQVIRKHHLISNTRRLRLNQKPSNLYVCELPVNINHTPYRYFKKASNIRSFYNFQISKDDAEEVAMSEDSEEEDLNNFDSQTSKVSLVTTIFSDLNRKIKVNTRDFKLKRQGRDEISEIDLNKESNELFKTIKYGFQGKRNKINRFIGANIARERSELTETQQKILTVLPQYCDYTQKNKKNDCSTCKAVRLYHDADVEKLTQAEVNQELSNHGHVKSLYIGKGERKHLRRTDEGRTELMRHYYFAHSIA